MPKIKRVSCIVNGEGVADRKFLQYLKSIHRDVVDVSVTVPSPYDGGGGSPVSVAKRLYNKCSGRSYDYGVIVVDGDFFEGCCKSVFKDAYLRSCQDVRKWIPRKCGCVVFPQCIENVLLGVYGVGGLSSTSSCKKEFKKKFKRTADEFELLHWQRHFPLERIVEASHGCGSLFSLLQIFRGSFEGLGLVRCDFKPRRAGAVSVA